MSPKKRSMNMAFTRKFLSSLGIEEDKVDTIIDAHAEVVDALKEEINKYKADAEKLPEVQRELDEAQKVSENGYEEKYNELKKEYDDYKAEVAEKEVTAKKSKAYTDLLKKVGISDKRIDGVVKYDKDLIKGLTLEEDGSIKDVEDLEEQVKSSWGSFIVTEETRGTNPAQPPSNTGGGMSKDDIMKIKDDTERQKAIAENHEKFGF